jgi:hypothetical protein
MKTLHTLSSVSLDTHETLKTLKADVVFGSPAKRCAGIGICQVNPNDAGTLDLKLPCCQKVETEINQIAKDQLEFRFSRSKICKKLIARQFAFSRFRLNDPLMLPDWLTDQLKIAPSCLTKGAYPVVFGTNFISVRIRMVSV